MSVDAPGGAQPPPNLTQQAAKGFMWTSGRTLFGRAMSLVSFVILARLLSREDYGLAALATVLSDFLVVLATVGLAQALVQQANLDETDLDTAFWLTTCLGLLLALALSAAAWPIAYLLDEPDLRPLLQVLSLALIFMGISSTHQAVLERRLAFAHVAKANMLGQLVATIVGIAFAFGGLGVWALVIQTVLAPAITCVGVVARSGYRPGLRVSRSRLPSLLRFSRSVVGIQFTSFLNMRSDDFLVGTALGTAALGVYTVAYRVLTVMISVLVVGTQGVIMPAFSRIQDDLRRVGSAYLRATRLTAVLTFPMFLFASAAAPELVQTVFGSKWAAAAPVMRVLCLVGPVYALSWLNTAVLTSLGRPHTAFRLQAAGAILQIAGFLVAVNFGIVWVAASFVIRAYAMTPVEHWIVLRAVDRDAAAFLRGLATPVAATAGMVAAMAAAGAGLPDAVPDAVCLGIFAVLVVPVYVGALRLLSRSQFAEALAISQALRPAR